MVDLLAVLLATAAALISTGLFFYGVWRIFAKPSHETKHVHALKLTRHEENPLLSPKHEEWEAQGVMNPAAVRLHNLTHLFYRAIGADGVSRLGYATSGDGRSYSRLPYPVFALSDEGADVAFKRAQNMKDYAALTASGGSWAGVEDPRAVVIDDRLYLTFSAFGGWNSLRMGVTSLPVDDLRAKRWKWTPPVYLSPQGQVHKNWVLFPEKIRGKFALLHSLHSGSRKEVLVDYLDTLSEEPAQPIESPYRPVKDHAGWDSTLRGAGPPPLKTPFGWLLLYHAIDNREPSRYKLGAMLLDQEDPSKVLRRSRGPILSPDARYENEGAKAGIVYACGATLHDDLLTVFYGGADSVVCAAKHSLSNLLSLLTAPDRSETYFRPRLA
jgi:beta-1,2-mannobiose phosphorylase / 1,2-beta-oligomannan phosphorylase